MKIYAVIKDTSYCKDVEKIYFTSKNKALGYILGLYRANNEQARGYDKKKQYYNATWIYDLEVLMDAKNCEMFKYVMASGGATYRIEKINVL